jgi:SAM-dependent methyltransferase
MTTPGHLYADLSTYYDGFCHEVDYAAQAAFAERAFDCFAASGGRACMDLACGTGQLLAQLGMRGFALSGLDNSAAMLAATARRCPEAERVLCDLAGFAFEGRFDLMTCFLYSMHYSHPVTAMAETLRRAFRALRPGGVVLFDLVDRQGLSRQRDVITRLQQDGADFTFQSGWHYSGHGDSMELRVTITRVSAAGRQHWTDQHSMTATTIAEVHALMTACGFAVTVLERDFTTLREWQGHSFNVVMVGQRPQN